MAHQLEHHDAPTRLFQPRLLLGLYFCTTTTPRASFRFTQGSFSLSFLTLALLTSLYRSADPNPPTNIYHRVNRTRPHLYLPPSHFLLLPPLPSLHPLSTALPRRPNNHLQLFRLPTSLTTPHSSSTPSYSLHFELGPTLPLPSSFTPTCAGGR